MSMSEFVTWEALGGYAGAVMMVTDRKSVV